MDGANRAPAMAVGLKGATAASQGAVVAAAPAAGIVAADSGQPPEIQAFGRPDPKKPRFPGLAAWPGAERIDYGRFSVAFPVS